MIKRCFILVFIINIFNISLLDSQNLVPNGSFEQTKCLTNSYNIIDSLLSHWTVSTQYGAVLSPDAFNESYITCQGFLSPSNSNTGFQKSRSGECYIGEYIGTWPNSIPYNYVWSELVAVKLNQPMVQNTQYKVRFFANLADSCYYGTDELGIHLSQDSVQWDSIAYANLNVQITKKGTGPILDTGLWTEISSNYTALGGENFIILGCFGIDSAILKVHRSGFPGPLPGNPFGLNKFIYYLYDDVSIWEADTIPPTSNAGTDTTICLGGKAKLGKHSYGDYSYEWFTKDSIFNNYAGLLQNGFMKYSNYLNLIGDSGFISVSPTQTTTYYCLATDFTYEKTLDSVTVYVVNCGQNDTTVCIEQSFLLGSTSNPNWNYKWSPPTYLNYDTIGQPLCSPTNDITYSLIIKNSNNDTVSLDTVNVFVANCYSAEAGIDTTICLGDSIQIGTHNHSSCSYVWWPNQWLSDSIIGMPFVKPDTLIKYFLQVIDTLGNVTKDSVLIGVIDCDTVGINQLVINNQELVIYPNPASGYMIVEFNELQQHDCIFELYDNIGRKVLERVLKKGKTQYQMRIEELESGIYFYKLEAGETFKGKIVIFK